MTLLERVARMIDPAIWLWHDDCLARKLSRDPAFELKRRTSLAVARNLIDLVQNPPPESAP